MSTRRTLIHAFALAGVATLLTAGLASAAQVLIWTNDDTLEELEGRGARPEKWMPVLDGQVFLDVEHGIIHVGTTLRPGGEDFDGPVLVSADAGARCVQTGNPPHARVYVFDCLEHVPRPPNRGVPDA